MAELDNTVVETEATEATEVTEAKEAAPTDAEIAANAEIAKLRRELAVQINKNDVLAKENASQKKQIRAQQTAEEAAAEEKKEADAALQNELNELRKKFAVADTSKKVMSFINDETTANTVAEYLYGAEDVDAAITAIQKAWTAREKALRLEYGKIPAPGAGSSDGPTVTKSQLDAMSYTERAKFLTEHPDEYRKLMGR